jgi:antitoxin ParD1/3/4
MPTSVALTPHFEKLTKQLVASGEYNNVSEVVREGLRLVEERQKLQKAKLKALRAAVKLGMDDLKAGRYIEFNSPTELDQYFDKMRSSMNSKPTRTALKKAA